MNKLLELFLSETPLPWKIVRAIAGIIGILLTIILFSPTKFSKDHSELIEYILGVCAIIVLFSQSRTKTKKKKP